ncbi:MAG: right-handed parallel beta-helix repeat-containing protein, partial [Bacteroidota bacterium]
QAAINAAPGGTTINIAAGSYPENVTVNKTLTLVGAGVTTVVNPGSGTAFTVTAGDVTIQALKVSSGTMGVSASGVSGLTLSGVTVDFVTDEGINITSCSNVTVTGCTSSNNGTGTNGSGINLVGVTGTSVVSNMTASSNKRHGLTVGDGSTNVEINGGTFENNGLAGDPNTGGGITVYCGAGTTSGTHIHGTITANGNNTAGIFLTSPAGGTSVTGTTIDGGSVSLTNNGSSGSFGKGGAGVILYGNVTGTTVTASFNRSGNPNAAGIIMVGIDNVGSSSPSSTTIANCTFTGYTGNNPCVVVDTHQGLKLDLNTPANLPTTTGNTPPPIVYVEKSGADGNNGIAMATPKLTIAAGMAITGAGTTIHVGGNASVYAENVVLNKSVYLLGDNGSPITTVTPASGNGISVSASSVRIEHMTVVGAPGNGISASGISDLVLFQNSSTGNTGSGAQLTNVSGVSDSGSVYSSNTDEGFNTLNCSNVTLANVTANSNGSGTNGSGVNLVGVTGTSWASNTTATGNTRHGLTVGDGSSGVSIIGGTFTGNGVAGDGNTGGGITIYAEAGNVTSTSISGTVNSSDNKATGITVKCIPGRTLSGTTIGDGTNTVTLSNNGSTAGGQAGGAGIMVFGPASTVTIDKASFTHGAVDTASGLIAVGVDNAGTADPTGVSVTNSTFTGYSSVQPGITTNDGRLHTSANVVTGTNNTFAFKVQAKVFLQGPYVGPAMSTNLLTNAVIPAGQPYNKAAFGNYNGGESAAAPANTVDWVLVDLRSTHNGSFVARRAAFLKNDGTIMETDGSAGVLCSELVVSGTAPGKNYFHYIVIRHRNHLPIMSKDSVDLPLSGSYDFTTALIKAFGTNPMKDVSGGGTVFAMFAGDIDANGAIRYNSNPSDRAKVLAAVSTLIAPSAIGYWDEDLNLDARIRYNSNPSDRALILGNVTTLIAPRLVTVP